MSPPAGTKKELLQYDGPLSEVDPDIAAIISNEKKRQVHGFQSLQQRLEQQQQLAACSWLGAAAGLHGWWCRHQKQQQQNQQQQLSEAVALECSVHHTAANPSTRHSGVTLRAHLACAVPAHPFARVACPGHVTVTATEHV